MFDKTPEAFWGERPRRSIRRPSGQGRKQAKACFRQSHPIFENADGFQDEPA
jgi:hypothetical protein